MKTYLKIVGLVFTIIADIHAQEAVNVDVGIGGIVNALEVDQFGRMHVAWGGCHYSVFDQYGLPVVHPVTFAGVGASFPHMEIGSTQTILVWRQMAWDFNDYILGRVYNRLDTVLSPIVEIPDLYFDATRSPPRITRMADSTFFIIWSGNGPQTPFSQGIYGQFCTMALQRIGSNHLLDADTMLTRTNIGVRMAIERDKGRLAVIWLRGSSWGNSLLLRLYTNTAVPLGPSMSVSPDISSKYIWGRSIVHLPSGGYLVAWSSVDSDSLCSIYLRKFDSDGTPSSSIVQANARPAIWASEAEVTVDSDGTSLVAWESKGNSVRVSAQRFDKDLIKISNEFFLSPSDDSVDQYWPLVQLFGKKIYATWVHGDQVRGSILDISSPTVSVQGASPKSMVQFTLGSYPNPFNARAVVSFTLPSAGWAAVTVYDILGRRLQVLAAGEFGSGIHSVDWRADSFPSGLYLLRLTSNGRNAVHKAMLLR